jgi:hypothetical protein
MRERNDEPTYPIDAISMLKADHLIPSLLSVYAGTLRGLTSLFLTYSASQDERLRMFQR